ncbi:hypothetical protein ABG768_016298, partial [Culter alburnus]
MQNYILQLLQQHGFCTQPSFESRNVDLSGSYLTTQSFPDGSTVMFECIIGHKPVNSRASKSVTCVGNQWTSLELKCTRKSCGNLPDFHNGRYEGTGILFGDKMTAVCNTGYMLAGQIKDRWCRDQGWDGRDPVCEVVKCEAPPTIENGQLDEEPRSTYDYLQVVSYKCNNGMSLIGSSTLLCSEDGTFKPDPPKCWDGCSKPDIPHAERIGGKSPPYKVGNFIDYKCAEGYTMIGDYHIMCSAEGWKPEPPKCIVVKCKTPPTIENGQLDGEPQNSYDYSQVVSYKCNGEFILTGSPRLRCSEDGTFKPDPPKCLAQCTQPSFEPKNVILSGSSLSTNSFPNGSTVTFECIIGHKPVNSKASKSVTCMGNQWTNLELTCTRKSCGSLPDFHNGRYEGTGILFGDKMTAVCNTGYMLAGQIKDRWCRDQGWDGRDPVCEVVKCEAPPTIENGQLDEEPKDNYDYSEAVSYKCNNGLSLIGSSTLYCSDDGTFKPDPPKCSDGCPKPEIPHAERIGGKSPPYKLGHFIDLKCDEGYTMKGDYHIVCSAQGWKPDPPKCIGPCGKPVLKEHVILTSEFHSKTIFPLGSKVTVECMTGYEPVDSTVSKSITCEETNWTELLLTCKVVKCKTPPTIENGQLDGEPQNSYDYSQVVSYKCNGEFILTGSPRLRCSEDGTFKPEPPKCLAPTTTATTTTTTTKATTTTKVTSKIQPKD